MRPKTGTLTPGFSSSRQRERGQSACPWRFREKGWGRGDSGSAPDVPREPGPDVPSTRGGGEWGLIPLITASEISTRIAEVVRSIVLTVFEVATPIVNILGIAQIILGLLLWFGARQEFLGWRLLVSGLLMLLFMNVVAPMLMQFI
jgi:hypothetical protein